MTENNAEKKYLILVSGKMRSGKNAFADLFIKECSEMNFSIRQDSFASSLKEMCGKEFDILIQYLNHFTEEVKANIPLFDDIRCNELKQNINKVVNKIYTRPDNWWEEKNDITRLILQIVGTNIFRKYVDDDHWIKTLVNKIEKAQEKFIIVTDARFPNEIDVPHKLVEDRQVISIKVERNTGIKSSHLSETALDDYSWFDYTIDNNGTLETLKESAHTILSDLITE